MSDQRRSKVQTSEHAPALDGALRCTILVVLLSVLAFLWLEPKLRERRLQASSMTTSGVAQHPLWVQYVMVGLGGFRGIAAEVLWLRASHLQEQGRYFEQVQLADWITALDPRATDAWTFNSWNLAYNISAMMPRFEDRVTWVDAGISLLRDRAIPTNPRDARLYRELGWLYQNKIGDAMDPAHEQYKLALARKMAPPLDAGGRPPPIGSEAALRLLHDHRLDPERMYEVEQTTGPLDWRLPQSHAIYWAYAGLPFARGFEHQAGRRMIHQNLIALIEQGRFTGDLENNRFTTAPNLDLIPKTRTFLQESVRLYANETKLFARFLHFAIRLQMQNDDRAGAQESYRYLQDLAGDSYFIPDFETLANESEVDEKFFTPHEKPRE